MSDQIVITRGHGATDWDVLCGPGVGSHVQREKVKEFKRQRENPLIAEVQHWDSARGIISRVVLGRLGSTPQPAPVVVEVPPPAPQPAPVAPVVPPPKPADATVQPKKEKTK